jgi:hypothetical protein
MSQIRLLSRRLDPTEEGATAPIRQASGPEHIRRHPAALEPVTPRPEDGRGRPEFVTVGLVLLSAAAVGEGYRCLNLIPAGHTDLCAALFAIVAVPAALFLARAHRKSGSGWPSRLIVVGVAVLVVATSLEMAVNRRWSTTLLGASDLLMAGTLFGSALIGGGFLEP